MTVEELNQLLNKVNKVKDNADKADEKVDEEEAGDNHKIRDGKTRSTLTLTFMRGFFGMLIFACFFVFFYNWAAVGWIIDLKKEGLLDESTKLGFLEIDKILSIIIGALGTSLGFIIGYYFKEKHS